MNNNINPEKLLLSRSFISKHEVSIFFLMSIFITWVIYYLVSFFNIENQTILSRWLLVAAFGPSMSALIITNFTNKYNSDEFPITRQVFLFFVLFSIIFGIELLDHYCWKHTISLQLIIVDIVIVSLGAILLSNIFSKKDNVRELIGLIFNKKIKLFSLIISILLWPLMIYLSTQLAQVFRMEVSPEPTWPNLPLFFIVFESFIWYLFFGGPLNEEIGWRGFALNKMQNKYSPLYASIIIGAIWGLWHLPLHIMGVYPFGLYGFLIRIFDIPSAIVFTWLYNRSNKSLIPVLFLHATRNTTSLFLTRSYVLSSLLLLVLSIIFVFTDKMWKKNFPK
ncbi:MAG: hypothetical protein A2W99_03510 [Bacteroidetes bacterium GWF2_33_16]|nr:MAG: hypothetical protein A2X00_11560 [Bacteroidetes bacterium GWE2_32_14]OFY08252.1 MAG: hypothetical protein A2W99_03510 [Bacteroidetes bacterium GWF2_33_16]